MNSFRFFGSALEEYLTAAMGILVVLALAVSIFTIALFTGIAIYQMTK